MSNRKRVNYHQIEPSARIVHHALGLDFTVINMTRAELINLRGILQEDRSGSVIIQLPDGNRL